MNKSRRNIPCQVESLEDRQLLAITTQLLDGGATLNIIGGSANESVNIMQNDADNTITLQWATISNRPVIELPHPVQTFTSSSIQKIVINLGAGNDQLTYQLGSDEMLFAKTLVVDLGAGNDSAFFDFGGRLIVPLVFNQDPDIVADDGGSEAPPVEWYQPEPASIKANLNITVQGNAGNDTVDAIFGNLHANLNYRTLGGAGNDSLSGDIAGSVYQGYSALIDQDGGAGNDTLSASLQQSIEVGGKLTVNQRGGAGNDTANFNGLGASIQGNLLLNQSGGLDNDTLNSTILAFWSSTGKVQARIQGDAGNDAMHTLIKRDDIPPYIALFAPLQPFTVDAIANGGAGRNTAWLTPNVISLFNQVKVRSWSAGFPIAVDPWPF